MEIVDDGEAEETMTDAQVAEEEARVFAEERAKLEAQKNTMLQDQVCFLLSCLLMFIERLDLRVFNPLANFYGVTDDSGSRQRAIAG